MSRDTSLCAVLRGGKSDLWVTDQAYYLSDQNPPANPTVGLLRGARQAGLQVCFTDHRSGMLSVRLGGAQKLERRNCGVPHVELCVCTRASL